MNQNNAGAICGCAYTSPLSPYVLYCLAPGYKIGASRTWTCLLHSDRPSVELSEEEEQSVRTRQFIRLDAEEEPNLPISKQEESTAKQGMKRDRDEAVENEEAKETKQMSDEEILAHFKKRNGFFTDEDYALIGCTKRDFYGPLTNTERDIAIRAFDGLREMSIFKGDGENILTNSEKEELLKLLNDVYGKLKSGDLQLGPISLKVLYTSISVTLDEAIIEGAKKLLVKLKEIK